MTPVEIITEAAAKGFRVELNHDGDGLMVWSYDDPPDDLVERLRSVKAELVAHLRARQALAATIDAARPPDVNDDRWQTAMRGLRAFLAAGHGAAAEAAGWGKTELYAVPEAWARVDQCGVGLLLGDAEVVSITPTEIRIKVPVSGSIQTFRRKPTPDLALVFRTHYEVLRRDFKHEDAEPLAYDRTVAFHQSHFKSDLETAKAAALAAMKEAKR